MWGATIQFFLWHGGFCEFQSTLPMWGATHIQHGKWAVHIDFNPHSPCGERPLICLEMMDFEGFQSTLPMRGATSFSTNSLFFSRIFQSTLPMRGATRWWRSCPVCPCKFQSTLPMRGATSIKRYQISVSVYFNPHSPCGERQGTNAVHPP